MSEFGIVIDGKRERLANRFPVINPANQEVFAQAAQASLDDLDRAVEAAKKAFKSWSQESHETRTKACHAVADIIDKHKEELALLLTREQGKPLNGIGSRFEIDGSVMWARFTADLDLPVKVLQDNNEGRVEQHHKPLGVVGSITPWNWPIIIGVWHIIPAIRAGNTVVIKPSYYTPLSTVRMVELMNEVLPAGVVNVVTGHDDDVNLGAAMSSHPDISKIAFTGSTATGKRVFQSAAETMKRMTLELGGNDAGIVLPDVNPEAIAEGLFWGGFINNGQTCAAMKRLYVHEDVYDQVCEALVNFAKAIPVGQGEDEKAILGPVANKMQFETVKSLVDAAKESGTVLLGGEPGEGLFYPPTIIADLTNDDPLVAEEQFGPALPIIKYSDIDEVIEQANANENGLGGSVWSQDVEKAKEIALKMECGSVWINNHGAVNPIAPFGGMKMSGVGRTFGEVGLAEHTDIQVIHS